VTGSVQLTSAGGPESRYAKGAVVTVPRVVGHLDLGLTACPGGALYPLIPQIRAAVQKRIKRYAKAKCKKRKGGKSRCSKKRRQPRGPSGGTGV
jgi:hypothetical protein